MVHGLNVFKAYFDDYAGQYVLIGGTACSLLLGKEGIEFRTTKDLDLVLIIEAVDGAFIRKFLSFIKDGG
ncbi:MAG: hypothetical protein VZT48_12665 [Bulleidia sp.]|nr:hypothetical protein [Bulleidia sp.]